MIMLMSGRRRRDFRKRDVVCVPNPELNREQTKKFQIRSASDGKSQREQRLDQRTEELLRGKWISAVQGEEFAKDLRQGTTNWERATIGLPTYCGRSTWQGTVKNTSNSDQYICWRDIEP